MVGARDHTHVVLDHDHRVPGVDQAVQLPHQHLDVGRVQTRRRLVEQVQGVAPAPALQLARQLDALGFPAGQLGRGLAQPQIPQPDVQQRGQSAGRRR
ncbi:hypothetical protein SVIOM342S_04537 [Streptomyces violaceorubidus]